MNSASVAVVRPLNRFLKMAVMAGVESAIQIHIDRGDDLNARDGNGFTLLMLSAARNKHVVCKLLLDAGADKDLLGPSGITAHAIAVAAGANEAAEIFASAIAPIEGFDPSATNVTSPSGRTMAPFGAQSWQTPPEAVGGKKTERYTALPLTKLETEEASDQENAPDFDLFRWEPEEERPPPDADSYVTQAASALQVAISRFEPIDSSADWEDIEAYLPERSLTLARTDDAEARENLRLLLLRAVREGSVPRAEVEALSLNDDRSSNAEAEALLSMVVNDLGAEVDERFEYVNANENFEVFVRLDETPDEEDIVADALAFVDNLTSRHADPLRIYQKEFQRVRLISAEEEVSLAKAMEVGLERALDALAAWPRGIGLTLAAGNLVQTGQRPLTWLSLGQLDVPLGLESAPEGESDTAPPDQIDEEDARDEDSQFATYLPLGNHSFSEALGRLANLPLGSAQQGPGWLAVRETLSSLQLSRRFLMELTDLENDGGSGTTAQYAIAMNAYQRARARMTAANLKLVFHLAKKFLYSGEPLDDLAQEGNIGLLKAVERFDWRRGFKFSTYATWWIRQQIGRHVADKCRTIRIPVHVYEKAQRLSRETIAFESETGRAPELDEIAARLGMSAHILKALRSLAPEPFPIHDILIDDLIAVEAQSSFVSPDPMDIMSDIELREAIDKAMTTLKPREEQVLRLRFGIGVRDSFTLEEIGQLYEVTRERIRQIEAKAIRKLMRPSQKNALSHAAFGAPFYKNGKRDENGCKPDENGQSIGSTAMPELVEKEISTSTSSATSGEKCLA